MSSIPKAVLYYSPTSVWSAVVRLTLDEKGYGNDEVDLRPVDLAKGENYDPSFLRINPKATVPALVVPLQKTLSEDVESRYKAITSTKDIVEFLDKSRSTLSVTHTTSTAPAPSLAPATISFAATSSAVISLLHSEAADPNRLYLFNAWDEGALKMHGAAILPLARGRQEALDKYVSRAQSGEIFVSEKVKSLWAEKKTSVDVLVEVLSNAGRPASELDAASQKKREEYLEISKSSWQNGLQGVLDELEGEIIGPLVLGDEMSIADVHVAAWLTRVLSLVGVNNAENGSSAMQKLREHIGSEKEYGKLVQYWEKARERRSWKKVYSNGMY